MQPVYTEKLVIRKRNRRDKGTPTSGGGGVVQKRLRHVGHAIITYCRARYRPYVCVFVYVCVCVFCRASFPCKQNHFICFCLLTIQNRQLFTALVFICTSMARALFFYCHIFRCWLCTIHATKP